MIYESKEFERLKRRKFRPYSKGHQMMYELAIARIKETGEQARIFEAGFGIGWGLERMLQERVVDRYTGLEPNVDSFEYVRGRVIKSGTYPNVSLGNQPFDFSFAANSNMKGGKRNVDGWIEGEAKYDEAFCIEVIEHVPMEQHLSFLDGLSMLAPRLWFSTPDIRKVPKEGVRTSDEWLALLEQAGFSKVLLNTDHWTYLYECYV